MSSEWAFVLENLGMAVDPQHSFSDACRALGLEPTTASRVLDSIADLFHNRRGVVPELMSWPELCRHTLEVAHPCLHTNLSHLDELVTALDFAHSGAPPACKQSMRDAYVAFRTKVSAHLRQESDTFALAIDQRPDGKLKSAEGGRGLTDAIPGLSHDHQKLDEDLSSLIALTGECAASVSAPECARRLHGALCEFNGLLQAQVFIENTELFPRVRAAVKPGSGFQPSSRINPAAYDDHA